MDLQQRMIDTRIAIVGLGYVGLPLAVEFGKKYDTIGFDINAARVAELRQTVDRTQGMPLHDLEPVVTHFRTDRWQGTGATRGTLCVPCQQGGGGQGGRKEGLAQRLASNVQMMAQPMQATFQCVPACHQLRV